MEWNPQTLQFLSECFLHTLSPAPEPRRHAESSLAEAADRPNYGLAVLRLVAEPSVDDQIRQAAAVNFKNHLRSRWSPAASDDGGAPALSPILDPEKEQIKSLIVPLMLSATPKIQSQLSEALAVIGKHDFPKSWPALLPELVSNLQKASQASDYTSINGILGTANSIFKKFRFQYKTNDLLLDLKYCLDNFAAPLLEIFLKTASLIDAAGNSGGNAANLRPLFESQRLCCRIFYSLNFQELPEFFEDHMKEWMTEFRKYLTTSYPALEGSGSDGVALVDELRAAVCENINLYMEKNEEEFQGYLNEFALAVWTLLGNVSQSSSRDQLAITAIKFLTTVSTSVHHTLFASEGVVPQICQCIVIPNVRLREDDEELFELAMHPQQYRAYKSGKAKADFEADLAKRKAEKNKGASFTEPQTIVVDVDGQKYQVTIGPKGANAPAAPAAQAAAPAAAATPGDGAPLASPLEGKFYLVKNSGDAPVKVGDAVKKGQTVCYIEAMKTFNAIAAEQDGVVTEICFTSGASVAEDDVLMKIK